MKDLRDTFRDMTPDEMREASREAEIAEWRVSNRFCGRCGAEMKPHDKPDGEEVVESGWFDREHLPEIPRHGSIARAMLDAWVEESRKEGRAGKVKRKVDDL